MARSICPSGPGAGSGKGNRFGVVRGDMRGGEVAVMSDQLPVGVKLEGIIEAIGHFEPEGLGRVLDAHAQTIPGVAAEVWIALLVQPGT